MKEGVEFYLNISKQFIQKGLAATKQESFSDAQRFYDQAAICQEAAYDLETDSEFRDTMALGSLLLNFKAGRFLRIMTLSQRYLEEMDHSQASKRQAMVVLAEAAGRAINNSSTRVDLEKLVKLFFDY